MPFNEKGNSKTNFSLHLLHSFFLPDLHLLHSTPPAKAKKKFISTLIHPDKKKFSFITLIIITHYHSFIHPSLPACLLPWRFLLPPPPSPPPRAPPPLHHSPPPSPSQDLMFPLQPHPQTPFLFHPLRNSPSPFPGLPLTSPARAPTS